MRVLLLLDGAAGGDRDGGDGGEHVTDGGDLLVLLVPTHDTAPAAGAAGHSVRPGFGHIALL